MTEREVRNLIRSLAEQAGSVRALAKEWGMSQGYLDKQIRGTQAIGDRTLRRLKLIRRKTYQFYPASRVGLNDLASEVGAMIADHESWREANDVVQRSQGQGSPMPASQVAKLLGITPKDLQRLLDNDSGFPEPDARVLRKPAWQAQTIYGWLSRKGLKAARGSARRFPEDWVRRRRVASPDDGARRNRQTRVYPGSWTRSPAR